MSSSVTPRLRARRLLASMHRSSKGATCVGLGEGILGRAASSNWLTVFVRESTSSESKLRIFPSWGDGVCHSVAES